MAEAKDEKTSASGHPPRGPDRRRAKAPLPPFLDGKDRRRGGDRRLGTSRD